MLPVKMFSLLFGILVSNVVYSQTLQFEFTAQREFGFGTAFGESLSGILTIDYGVQPDQIIPTSQYCGEEARWFSGLFSVDVTTTSGYAAGTTFDGGNMTAVSIDEPCRTSTSSNSFHSIENIFNESNVIKITRFETVDRRASGDGVADWFDFDPTGDLSAVDEFSIVYLSSQNFQTGEFSSWFYRVDSFHLIVTSIVIDGVDTGITDFEYEGTLVSEMIQQFAETAKNHGKFASSIAKLTNHLKKAGLLTDEQRRLIMKISAESSIGKK